MDKPKNTCITSFFSPQPTQEPGKNRQNKTANTKKNKHAQRTRTPPPPPIAIDLTLDSPLLNNPSPKKLKTFSQFENARRQKITHNSRPIVSPAWPSEDLVHQRFLQHQDLCNVNVQHDHAVKLLRRKGKRPMRNPDFLDSAQEETAWMKNLVDTDPRKINDSSPPPTLNRLDLQPPINLIPQANHDPFYQHPLLQRLLELLKCTDGSPMTFDHPTLRRQHHRSNDSLIHLWTTKYAPKKASEMLGDRNVRAASTLKSWLLEIALKEAHHLTEGNLIVDQPSDLKKSKKRKKAQEKLREPKRVIIRSVEGPKRRSRRILNSDDSGSDGMKDFIVSDETDDEDTIFARDISLSESESRGASRSPRSSLQTKNYLNPDLEPVPESCSSSKTNLAHEDKIKFKNLTNLILLQGPNGAGKSCAVQAVAEELGWEVFEVNPGVLRNRKELDRLIGDVSKNHFLSCSSPKKLYHTPKQFLSSKPSSDFNPISDPSETKPDSLAKPINPFAKMMQKTTRGDYESQLKRKIQALADEDEESNSILEVSSTGNNTNQPRTAQNPTKQSLILLEEVDIIYGQDKDFWAGVVELVSKSMRPIVMTCNDSSTLPLESLPIQMILEFKPPSAETVSRFFQMICLIEGHLIDLSQLEKFYLNHVYELPVEYKLMGNKKTNFNMFEMFQFPWNDTEYGVSDVRRSMNQLQFFCQWAIGSRFLGIDWLDLEQDKTRKMLFCSHSLPAFVTTKSDHLVLSRRSGDHINPLDRFGDHYFELDWFNHFFRQLQHQNSHQQNQVDPALQLVQTSTCSHLDHQLFLLAKAHEDLSFTDAFVDKDFDIDQFESEIACSTTDNIILDNSRLSHPSIEIKKTKNNRNHSYSKSFIDQEEDYDFDLQYQSLHPKRPFSLSHYSLEKTLSRDILFYIFDSLSLVDVDHHLPHSGFLFKYFMPFNHAELVKIRTRNLKEMNTYMNFDGAMSITMNMKEYITEYNAYVRLIFNFDQSKRLSSLEEHPPSTNHSGRVLRKSSRLNNAIIHPSFVLDLSPLEISQFLSFVKYLL